MKSSGNVCLPKTIFSNLFTVLIFFQCLFKNHSLSFNHDLPKWSQYKNWFYDTLLLIEPKICISSQESIIIIVCLFSARNIAYLGKRHDQQTLKDLKRLLKIFTMLF